LFWFCTAQGLSKFDGYRFDTYGVEQGLESPSVVALVEARDGTFWIATSYGLWNFSPEPSGQRFTRYPLGDTAPSNSVLAVLEDRDGRIWAGTSDGLFMVDPATGGAFVRMDLHAEVRPTDLLHVEALAEDADGTLWLGTTWGLMLRFRDGATMQLATRKDGTLEPVRPLLIDRDGRAWIGHMTAGVLVVRPPADLREHAGEKRLVSFLDTLTPLQDGLPAMPGEYRVLRQSDGLAGNNIWSLHEASDGRVRVGTLGRGFSEVRKGVLRTFNTSHGLTSNTIRAVAEDSAGHIWLGSETGGAMRLDGRGIIGFTTADGLEDDGVRSVFEDRDGELYVVTLAGQHVISRFDGDRFVTGRPRVPGGPDAGWGWHQVTFRW
jgi:sugar lactone lactonase YvrE